MLGKTIGKPRFAWTGHRVELANIDCDDDLGYYP